MKLGLHSFSYRCAAGLWDYAPQANAPMSAGHFLHKAAELNLDGVFFCDPRHFESLEYGPATALREEAEALGLSLEVGMSGTHPDRLQDLVRAAHVLGSLTVRASVDKPRPRTAAEMDALLSAAATDLTEVLPLCERYTVPITLENTPNLTSAEVLSLLERVDSEWLRVCFDAANPLVVLEDPLTAATALAPYTSSVHLKDYQLCARKDGLTLVGCPLGDGVVDLRSIIDLLSTRAPALSFSIETTASKQPLPVLEEEYLSHLPGASAAALARTLRLVRDHGVERLPQFAWERQAEEDEILAEEDDQVVRSAHWAQRTLGRPEAEDLEPGE